MAMPQMILIGLIQFVLSMSSLLFFILSLEMVSMLFLYLTLKTSGFILFFGALIMSSVFMIISTVMSIGGFSSNLSNLFIWFS